MICKVEENIEGCSIPTPNFHIGYCRLESTEIKALASRCFSGWRESFMTVEWREVDEDWNETVIIEDVFDEKHFRFYWDFILIAKQDI